MICLECLKGPREKGSWEEGEIIDYPHCQNSSSCLSSCCFRLHSSFATGTPFATWRYILFSLFLLLCIWWCSVLALLYDHQFLASCPPLPKEGPITAEIAPADSESPEAFENQDGDGV
jgi:hypothetical protein